MSGTEAKKTALETKAAPAYRMGEDCNGRHGLPKKIAAVHAAIFFFSGVASQQGRGVVHDR